MNPAIKIFAEATRTLFVVALLLLGGCGFAIAWLVVESRLANRAGWMALIAALIVIALLRAARAGSWMQGAHVAVLVTAAYLASGEWLVVTLPIAADAGQSPLAAAPRMGADFVWILITSGNTPLDWGWMLIALLLAGWFGR